jgi:tetratricopeptide (TPR) repeat protein
MTTTAILTAALVAASAGFGPAIPAGVASASHWVVCATPNQDAACAHLHRAEEHLREGRQRAAGRELERAVRARRAAGQYAGEELWRLAAFRFASGQNRRAIRTLDELAAEAQRSGDISRHAIALTEAVILSADLRDHPAAALRLERLRPLLDSPYLPAATQDVIRQRLVGV